MAIVKCPSCGSRVSARAFCGACGEPLTASEGVEDEGGGKRQRTPATAKEWRDPSVDESEPETILITQEPEPGLRAFVKVLIAVLAVAGIAIGAWTLLRTNRAQSPSESDSTSVTIETHTIAGGLVLSVFAHEGNYEHFVSPQPGDPCGGYEGFDDIKAGTQVLVKDQGGTVIATGALAKGTVNEDRLCRFPIEVSSVPKAAFYQVSASHRGGPTYSYDQMVKNYWTVTLSL